MYKIVSENNPNTIQRVAHIVTFLAVEGGYHRLSEIAQRLHINKATVYRILSSLSKEGWITKNHDSRKYTLSTGLLEIALQSLSNFNLRNASIPGLYHLRDITGETAMLSLRLGIERMYIEQIQGIHEVRQIVELGRRYPLWCGAPGKAILAFMRENEQAVVMKSIESGVHRLASGHVLQADKLHAELVRICRQGFAVSCEERVLSTTSVAAPIFLYSNNVCGSISVAGPLPRFTVELATHYGGAVIEAADRVRLELRNAAEI